MCGRTKLFILAFAMFRVRPEVNWMLIVGPAGPYIRPPLSPSLRMLAGGPGVWATYGGPQASPLPSPRPLFIARSQQRVANEESESERRTLYSILYSTTTTTSTPPCAVPALSRAISRFRFRFPFPSRLPRARARSSRFRSYIICASFSSSPVPFPDMHIRAYLVLLYTHTYIRE